MYNESYISLGGTLVTLPDNTKQFNAMDNIGSVRLTVSVKGQDIATEHFDYKPFGDTLNAEGESRIGYAAQERDEESRYFAMGARQYDPLSGRFLSVDPLYESFPDKTPYHYCNNNPISFKDPSGLSPEGEKGKEDEVQVNLEGDEAQSNEILNMILQYDSDYRNSMKIQNTYDIDGEAMADASRQRMQDFGGSGGQGFNNTGWEEKYGDRTGDDEDEKNGVPDENSYEEIAGDEEIPEDYEGKKEVTDPDNCGVQNPDANCASYTLHDCQSDEDDPGADNDRGGPGTDNNPYDDLKERGYRQLDFNEPNQPGDIIVYVDPCGGLDKNGNPYKDPNFSLWLHIGTVVEVDKAGNTTLVDSKFGPYGGKVYLHHPRDTDYGPNQSHETNFDGSKAYYRVYYRKK